MKSIKSMTSIQSIKQMQDHPPTTLLSPAVRRVLWLLALLAAVAWYANFRVIQPLRGQPFSGALHGNDFKHIYLGAWMLARGQAPYDNPYDPQALQKFARSRGFQSVNPYVYLPFTGLALSPLTLLDPPDALRCWFWLNHLFLAAAFFLMFRALRLAPNLPNLTTAVAVAALCYPFHRTLTAGQLNCALLFLFALVFALERGGRPVLAGAVAAFAFLFKLAPGILLVYFLWSAFLRRRLEARDCGLGIADCGLKTGKAGEKDCGLGIADCGLKKREAGDCNPQSAIPNSQLRNPQSAIRNPQSASLTAAGAMIAVAALLLLLSVAWVGVGRHRAFLPLLKQMSYGQSTWAQFGEAFYRDPYNQSLNSFFHHILVPWRDMRPWWSAGADWANMLTRLALLICVAAAVWRTWPSRAARLSARRTDPSILFALFILLSLLAPSIYWDHYAVIALWPLFACYARLPERARPWSLGLMVSLALLLGGILELTPLRGAVLGVATAVMATGLLRQGCRSASMDATCDGLKTALHTKWQGWPALMGAAWSLAGAFLLARFPYGYPVFHQGLGLVPMSLILWGTLILFGLCLVREAGGRDCGLRIADCGLRKRVTGDPEPERRGENPVEVDRRDARPTLVQSPISHFSHPQSAISSSSLKPQASSLKSQVSNLHPDLLR